MASSSSSSTTTTTEQYDQRVGVEAQAAIVAGAGASQDVSVFIEDLSVEALAAAADFAQEVIAEDRTVILQALDDNQETVQLAFKRSEETPRVIGRELIKWGSVVALAVVAASAAPKILKG